MSKITQITIENFKSIKNLNHIFKPYGFEKDKSQTTILLGVNESGKSNFLRAIQVLSKGFEGSYDEICYKESQDDEHDILIKGGFIVEDQERFQQLLSSIQLFPEEINKVIKLIYIEKEFSLKANNSTLIAYDFGISILGNRYQFDNKSIIKLIETNIDSGFEELTDSKIKSMLDTHLLTIVDDLLPPIVYWSPDFSHLINGPISITSFIQNPDISIPFQNILNIYGAKDIDKMRNLLTRAQRNYENMAEFTSKLSERVSDHINRIWPSHLINIKFNCNADFITIVVEDKNAKNRFYKMNQRSEGFKQFVSLMLSLSAKNNGDLLRNNVIIIDEPENHLHPGGIVEMRNELLKIGKNNQMIISTHSNFMVDTTTMERHWLLIKNTETILKQIDESTSLFDEEVVSRAFGIEIMKELIPNNIIVCEGHSDKLVIELMLNQLSQNLSYSIKSAGGCSKVYSVCSILAAEKFKPFVFLDSDNEGVKAKSDITNNLKETYKGNVKTLADLGLKTQNASIEDLYPREYVKNWILSNYSVDIDNFIDLAVIDSLKAQGIKDKEQLKKLKTKLSEDFVNHYKDKTLFMNEAENLVSIGKKFIELLKTN